jgi:hypothetical protein
MKRVVWLLIGSTVLLVGGSGGDSTAHPLPEHPTNGCTLSPDRPPPPEGGLEWDFKLSCDHHDVCYGDHYFGSTESGRERCDGEFYDNLVSWCVGNIESRQLFQKRACKATGWVYYRAVRRFGCFAFSKKRPDNVFWNPTKPCARRTGG